MKAGYSVFSSVTRYMLYKSKNPLHNYPDDMLELIIQGYGLCLSSGEHKYPKVNWKHSSSVRSLLK